MGFAKYYEDIQRRYWDNCHYWGQGAAATVSSPPRQDPYDRPRRVINDFWKYYHAHLPRIEDPDGLWEKHFANVRLLHDLLTPVMSLTGQEKTAWNSLCSVEQDLRTFFRDRPDYGLLSRSIIDEIARVSSDIRSRCLAVERELREFVESVKPMSKDEHQAAGLETTIAQLQEIGKRLNEDLKSRRQYDVLTRDTQQRWQQFLHLHSLVAVQRRYRPALQHLDRLRLNDQQERFVALDHDGEYRIQGASGSGKTIILIHRAIRLAAENPDAHVRVFTINRSLADLLRSSVRAIHGTVPPNLHVAAFYDFLLGCLSLFEPMNRYRLVDDLSGEHIQASWHDFYHHRGQSKDHNIFAETSVRELIESIEGREALRVDASHYLRDEMVYIQSAYRTPDRYRYITAPRVERSIPLLKFQRAVCLAVLDAWEEWLEYGELCDVDGLTLQAVKCFEQENDLARIRSEFPTDFVLIDEVQDFSTLELQIARKLISEPQKRNKFFLVGDLNQKVYAKHHDSVAAGFNFRGKAALLGQNFRNTRQILRAAYRLPAEFPPQAEEKLEIAHPDYSIYEGGKPIALECTAENHVSRVLEILDRRSGSRVGIISENDDFLRCFRAKAVHCGYRCFELFRVEDLHLWKQQQGDALSAAVVVSRLEAVKGFEFDTVIACDFSEDVIPRRGVPRDEYWREAAIAYSALTRARDELIITYVGSPSVFLHVMEPEIDLHPALDDGRLRGLLGSGGHDMHPWMNEGPRALDVRADDE